MDLYLSHPRAAALAGLSDADLRTLRRVLRPPIRIARPRQGGRGKPPDYLNLTDLLAFLNNTMGGLPYQTQYKMAFASAPIDERT